MEPTTAVVTTEPLPPQNPLALIQMAIERGMDPERLGRLMDLQERWEKSRAAEQFAAALSAFQRECPPILKSRATKGEKLGFKYASLDDIMEAAGPLLSRHEIVPTYTTRYLDSKLMEVTCRLRVGIHTEETSVTIPVPTGAVNSTQLFGQAVSYGKRYALCAALGIVTTDRDNDAANCWDYLSEEEVQQVDTLLRDTNADRKKFLAWAGAESLDRIKVKDLPKVLQELRRKAEKLAKGGSQ